jgi:hypothetical protein
MSCPYPSPVVIPPSGYKNNFAGIEPLTSIKEVFNRIRQLVPSSTSPFIDQEEVVSSLVSITLCGDQSEAHFQWYLFVLSLPPSLRTFLPST